MHKKDHRGHIIYLTRYKSSIDMDRILSQPRAHVNSKPVFSKDHLLKTKQQGNPQQCAHIAHLFNREPCPVGVVTLGALLPFLFPIGLEADDPHHQKAQAGQKGKKGPPAETGLEYGHLGILGIVVYRHLFPGGVAVYHLFGPASFAPGFPAKGDPVARIRLPSSLLSIVYGYRKTLWSLVCLARSDSYRISRVRSRPRPAKQCPRQAWPG
jgi:hypothetical protein